MFVPVAFMKGMVGRFFFQFGVTVAVAVAISYFVSMTLTPMLSARLLATHGHGTARVGRGARARSSRAIERGYRRILEWALAHRGVTVAAAVRRPRRHRRPRRGSSSSRSCPRRTWRREGDAWSCPSGTPLEETAGARRSGLAAQIRARARAS